MDVTGLTRKVFGHRRTAVNGLVCAGLALLAAHGCGTLDNQGDAGENDRPEVFIVSVPPDGSEFAASPTVYWYGTDSDGQILRYDYTVVTAEEVDTVASKYPGPDGVSLVDKYIAFVLSDSSYDRWTSTFVDSAQAGELPTQRELRLYASPFPAECDTNFVDYYDPTGFILLYTDTVLINCVSDTVPQFFFLRGVDDRGLYSMVKYRSYKRRNHWPTTEIHPSFDQYAEYVSLPRLTATYGGVELKWRGTDPLDFVPPSVPFLEFHWQLYGPFVQEERPTVDQIEGHAPIWESANPDARMGVWVRDTTAVVYDLWRQADSIDTSPLNDTSKTRSAWFIFVVTGRDDAFISDETPAVGSFKAVNPKFERQIVYVDDGWYTRDSQTNPCSATNCGVIDTTTNQNFYWNLVKMVYPEADTMEDFWWRSEGAIDGQLCDPESGRVRCGNYLSLDMLLRHRLCVFTDDDVHLQSNAPTKFVLRRYLEAGGMVWFIGRHSLLQQSVSCGICKEKMVDLCTEGTNNYDRLGCTFFDIEAMYYPAWRANANPVFNPVDGTRIPTSNDEFVAATLVAPGSGLPSRLEIDPERVACMYVGTTFRRRLGTTAIYGVPDVNFLVLGSNSLPLYTLESWRPGGPIPPTNGPSFSHDKPVVVRRVGPDRVTPLYKTCYTSFPMYFLKQEHSEELFRKMADPTPGSEGWFFLPFSKS